MLSKFVILVLFLLIIIFNLIFKDYETGNKKATPFTPVQEKKRKEERKNKP